MYLTRNQAWWQHHRGFESHLLRQVNSLAKLRGYFFTGLALFALHCFAELAGRGCGGWVPHTGVPEIVTHPPHPHPAANSRVGRQKFSVRQKLSRQGLGG